MKKATSILICIMIISGIFNLPVYAYLIDETESNINFGEIIPINNISNFETLEAENQLAAEQVMLQAIYNFESEIDITDYDIMPEELGNIFSDLLMKYPRIFHLKNSYSYSYWDDSGFVCSVYFSYTIDQNEYEETQQKIDIEEKKIISLMDYSMSDAERCLVAHDYIASHFEYDTGKTNYDIGSFINQRKGVCQAYTLFLMDLLEKIGIPCVFVPSKVMNHSWNMVCIDNNWYHIDITYDDPLTDKAGTVSHNCFLADDTTIAGDSCRNHKGWTAEHTSDDSKYANYFWNESTAPFVYANGKWYTMGFEEYSPKLYSYDFATNTETEVASFDYKFWNVWDNPNSFFGGTYSGAFAYHGYVVFNLKDGIYVYNPKTGIAELKYSADTSSGYVYGCYNENERLIYCTTTHPNYGSGCDGYELHTVYMDDIIGSFDGISNIVINIKGDGTGDIGGATVNNFEDSRVNDFYFAVYDSLGRMIYIDAEKGAGMFENYPYVFELNETIRNGAYIKAFVFETETLIPVLKSREASYR